jgi:cytochrome c-type biogenesis protein CcmH/NrfG
MLLLLSLQALMVAMALLVLATPFIHQRHSLFSKNYWVFAALILMLSSLLYSVSRDREGLSAWFAGGQEHYRLLEKFNELGGVDGAIMTLQKHLMEQPGDAKGWFLLGKLYLGKQDEAHAKLAFTQAHKLDAKY